MNTIMRKNVSFMNSYASPSQFSLEVSSSGSVGTAVGQLQKKVKAIVNSFLTVWTAPTELSKRGGE